MRCLLCCILLFTTTGCVFAQGEERIIAVNDVRLNVRIVGKGSPIMVVHGGPGLNHSYFLPHLVKLAERHRLIFIDQRACGQSSADLDSAQMTLEWLLRDMEGVRKKLGLGKVTVMAHSWGALPGLLYAARYPKSVSGLILCDAVSPKQGEFDLQTNKLTSSRYSREDSLSRLRVLRSAAFKDGAVEAYDSLFRLSFKQSFYDKVFLDSLDLDLPHDFVERRRVLFYMSGELSAYDFYPELKNIVCKTLIVHGDYDAIPVLLPRKLHNEIRRSEVVVIKDAGHFPFIEKREEFLKVVGEFLEYRD